MRAKSTEDRKLLEAFDPIAEALGFVVVRVRLMGSNTPDGARRLQVMAERPADRDINVNQCARLSRAISAYMDEADPITGEYILEVSSPGIDRPLTRLSDFIDFEGLEGRIELDRLAEGRKRFRGILRGVEDDHVAIDLDDETETTLIPYAWIVEAKLVLNDELMARGAALRAQRIADGELEEDEEEDFDDDHEDDIDDSYANDDIEDTDA